MIIAWGTEYKAKDGPTPAEEGVAMARSFRAFLNTRTDPDAVLAKEEIQEVRNDLAHMKPEERAAFFQDIVESKETDQ
jgi:hypothetical protein